MIFKLSGRPTGKRVIVLPDEAESLYKGRIIIPDTAKEKPAKGRVIQVGPDVTVCKPGDEVLYGQYSGSFVDFDITEDQDGSDSKPFLLMIDSDITYVWECEEAKEEQPDIDQAVREKVKEFEEGLPL